MRVVVSSELSKLNEEQEYARFKDDLARSGIVPIYDLDKLYVYKIKGTDKLKELKKELQEKYSEIYQLILSRPQYDMTYCKESLKSFGDLIKIDTPTDEEIFNMFELNNKTKKDNFYASNVKYIQKQNDLDGKNEYSLESFDEMLNRYKNENALFTFRKNSKLSSIIDLIENGYFSLEAYADSIYKFMCGKSISGQSVYTAEQKTFNIINMSYTNEEKRIRLLDRFKIIKEILTSLDIELVYSGSISELPNISFEQDMKLYKCNINRLARENAKLLYDSEFKETYDRIINQKVKTFY